MAQAAPGALLIFSLLALAACQTQRAQDTAPSPPAVQNAAPPPAVQPPPATFRPEPAPAPPPATTPAPTPTTPTAATPAPKSGKPKAPIKASAPVTTAAPTTAPPTAAPSATAPPATSPAAAPAAAPKSAALDLNGLEQRLKDTRAIGVFTKLSLKNQVDDLLDELREFHKGSTKTSQSVLRQKYDLLILKVLSLLQDGDPTLASAISSSREALWQILMDPNKFAKI